MKITFAPRGIIQIDNARIIHRNFRGEGSKFNREGDRNFSVVIPTEEMADELVKDGWAVKIKPPRDEFESPFMFLPVKVKFNDYGPNVYLVSGKRMNRLDEDSVAVLDDVDILNVDLDIGPYEWAVSGKTGKAAYLRAIKVTQNLDRFAARASDDEYPEE